MTNLDKGREGGGQKSWKFCGHHMYMAPYHYFGNQCGCTSSKTHSQEDYHAIDIFNFQYLPFFLAKVRLLYIIMCQTLFFVGNILL